MQVCFNLACARHIAAATSASPKLFLTAMLAKVAQGIEVLTKFVSMAVNLEEGRVFIA